MRFRSIVLVAIASTLLAACPGHSAPPVASASTTSSVPPAFYLRAVFSDEGIVVEPPLYGAPRWSRERALQTIRRNSFFNEGRVRTWFGSFEGQAGWLAIADGVTVAPHRGAATRGYRVAVFADDEDPARALNGVAETAGQPPRVNVAAPRPKYNGRLHVTFVTPSGGPIGGSLAKWMMEPAPWAQPRLSLEAARARAKTIVGAAEGRLYFGLFTGLDNTGTLQTRTPAWMAFDTGYMTRFEGSRPCCDRTPITFDPPAPTFGASVFADREDWVSGTLSAGGHPVVY